MYTLSFASDVLYSRIEETQHDRYQVFDTFRQNACLLTTDFDNCVEHDCQTDDDESRKTQKGWMEIMEMDSLILLFRSLLTTLMTQPPLMTVREWNKLMRAYNGNWSPRKKKKLPAAPSFNIMAQNIPGTIKQDVQKVGTYIAQVMKRFQPAILFLSEVDPGMVSANCPPDYDFIKGTLLGKDNIRVCALVKVNIPYRVKELNLMVPTVVLEIDGWTFVGLYREWSYGGDISTKNDRKAEAARFRTLISWWRARKGRTLIMGDFNFDPDPDPKTPHQVTLWEMREMVESEITMRGWNQLVSSTTRTERNTTPSLIDHIYVNRDNFVERVYNECTTGTDHYTIGVKVRVSRPIFVSRSFLHRNVDKVKPGDFEAIFCQLRIHEIYQADNVNIGLSNLERKILHTLNIVAPEKRVETKEKYAKWMTPQILEKIRIRNGLRKKAEVSWEYDDWTDFKKYQKSLMKEMRAAKFADFKEDMDTKDSKLRWARVMSHAKLNQKKENDIVLEIDGEEHEDPHVVSKKLNDYFKFKVVNLRKDLDVSVDNSLDYTTEYVQGKKFEKFDFRQVSTRTVKRVISQLTNTGALGHDGIGTKVLKKWKHVIGPPLRHIINMSIHFGEYPVNWKLGTITPLPKGGNPREMKNWRPICINNAMSKVLETVLNDQISNHMESQKLYSKTQHAYRRVRSVNSALLELDTMIRDQLDQGKVVGVLTTDVSAGFNLVSKDILIPKMARLGFGEDSQELLENYLSGRRTKVKVKNAVSPPVSLDTGVGEGSVLGPNFFSCGMTDVSVVASRVRVRLEEDDKIGIWCSQIEYADDCTPVMATNTEQELQRASDKMLEGYKAFYSANGLKLNETKCHLLVIRPGKKTMTLTCAGQAEVESIKLLGLHIDNKLTYKKHTEVVRGRLKDKIEALERVQNKASLKTMTEITVALVHSTIEFMAELYLREESNQKRIQKMLNDAMRMLLNKRYGDSCTDMMYTLDWLNVPNMYRWVCIRTMRRMKDHPSMMPETYSKLKLNDDPQRDLRYNALKLEWKVSSKWTRESFISLVVGLYNRLGLHGRLFMDKEEARDSIKSSIVGAFGNINIK